jgi:hypothetical protein
MTLMAAEYRPTAFRAVFVEHGWRGIEHYFGARTAVNKRWMSEGGPEAEAELKALRLRYRRGDVSALEQVRP